jgi:CBS domain-containing protein
VLERRQEAVRRGRSDVHVLVGHRDEERLHDLGHPEVRERRRRALAHVLRLLVERIAQDRDAADVVEPQERFRRLEASRRLLVLEEPAEELDLRRHLEISPNLTETSVQDVMTKTPKTIRADRLAAEALRLLREYRIDELVVVDGRKRPVGLLDVQDLLKAGF